MDHQALVDAALGSLAAKPADLEAATRGETVRGRKLRPREAPPSPTDGLPDLSCDLETLRELGRGGMGVVELARQRSVGREVAVKRVARDHDAEAMHGLLEEARIAGRLEHPNVVPVHAIARSSDGSPLLVMKHVEGVPWSKLIHDAAHPMWAELRGEQRLHHLSILIHVCRAVELAHARGYLHRDLKPSNVMLGAFGEVYLLDFGLAIERGRVSELPAHYVQGTLQYMAPEMLQPELALIDERTDVYLLGACLHEALTGSPRHKGEHPAALLFAAAKSAPCDHGDGVAAELAAICRKATSAERDDRFPSARALREALEDFLAHRASIELTDAAAARLAELREAMDAAEPDPVRVGSLHRECRFGFEQALRSWSDNTEAREGLRRTIEHALEHELRQRNPAAARVLLAELDPAPEGARARVEALEAEILGERAAASQLAHVREAFDDGVSRRERSIAAWMIGGALLATALTVLTLFWLGVLSIDRDLIVHLTFAINGVALLAGGLFWRKLAENRFNQLMSLVVGVALSSVLVNRGKALLFDESLAEMVASDAILMAALFAIAGAVLRRVFLVGTVCFVAVSFIAVLAPDSVAPVLGTAGVLTVLSILLARGNARKPLITLPEPGGGPTVDRD